MRHIFGAKIGQRVAFTHAAYHNRAVQADKALADIGEANMMPGERLLQHRFQLRRNIRFQRLGANQRINAALQRQLPQ